MLMLGTDYSTAFRDGVDTDAGAKQRFMSHLQDNIKRITEIRNSQAPPYDAAAKNAVMMQVNDMIDWFNAALSHFGTLSWYDYGMQMIATLKKAADYVTGTAQAYQMAPKTVPMPTGANAGASTGSATGKPNYLLWGGIAAGAVALWYSMR